MDSAGAGAGAGEFSPLGLTASRNCSSVFPRDFSQIFLFASFIAVMEGLCVFHPTLNCTRGGLG